MKHQAVAAGVGYTGVATGAMAHVELERDIERTDGRAAGQVIGDYPLAVSFAGGWAGQNEAAAVIEAAGIGDASTWVVAVENSARG